MENNDVVILELDRPRELKLSHMVLKRFCAKHKIGLSELSAATDNYDTLIDLLLTMLQREDPSLTADRLDEMLDEIPFIECFYCKHCQDNCPWPSRRKQSYDNSIPNILMDLKVRTGNVYPDTQTRTGKRIYGPCYT